MRTIAGQIQSYKFPDLNGPSSLEEALKAAWASQIGEGAQTDAQNFDGNEHLGASFGGAQPFPNLSSDVSVPNGSRMAIEYSVDEIVTRLNAMWAIATSQKNRVRTDNLDPAYQVYGVEPDSTSPIELKSLTVTSKGTTWNSVIDGEYHVGHGLSDVPFSITFSEGIRIDPTISTSTSVTYLTFPPILQAHTSNLLREIHAIEAGAAVFGIGLAGVLAIPLLAMGIDRINDYLLSALQPVSGSLDLLKSVVQNIPQRFAIPGTTDNIIFHYDNLVMPQGQIAGSGNTDGVVAAKPGSSLVFLGAQTPVRTRRLAFVQIAGHSSVKLPTSVGVAQDKAAPAMMQSYFAEVNDEVENPTFHWTLVPPSPDAAKTVSLTSTQGQQVSITFNHNNLSTPEGTYILKVNEDDSLHLKDKQGQAPSANMHIVVIHEALTPPKPSGAKVPGQLPTNA